MNRMRETKKGLSYPLTALLILIAAIIITLVIVSYTFGLIGAINGTPKVIQVSSGILSYNPSTGTAVVSVTLYTTGDVKILGAQIADTPYSVAYTQYLTAGANGVTITFTGVSGIQKGSTYTILITLSDGQTVEVAVLAQ